MRAALLLTLSTMLIGCSSRETDTTLPLRPVYTSRVNAPSPVVERSFSGRIQSADSSSVAFTTGGRLIEVAAVAGKSYTAGDTLARIDPTDAKTALAESEARFTEAQSAMRRTQSLFENGNASKSQLESAMASAQAARSNFDAAKKRVDDCTLAMPYDGVIGRVNVSEQEMVTAGQAVMSLLANSDSLEFEIGVPDEWIGQVEIGMPGSLSVSAIRGKTFAARVSEVGVEQDSNTTYPVVFTFENSDADIRESMDGEMTVQLSNPLGAVITVPVSCVAALPGDVSYVYTITASGEQGTLQRQEVKTGQLRKDGRIEVLEGLSAGMLLVSRGVHKLAPGTTVLLRDDLVTE